MLFNLYSWRKDFHRYQQQRLLLTAISYSLLIIVIIIFWHWYLTQQITKQRSLNQRIKQQVISLQKKYARVVKLQDTKQVIQQSLQDINKLQTKRLRTNKLFLELNKIIPAGIHLIALEKKTDLLILLGKAKRHSEVMQLVKNIKGSSLLHSPIIHGIKTDTDSSNWCEFKIECKLL